MATYGLSATQKFNYLRNKVHFQRFLKFFWSNMIPNSRRHGWERSLIGQSMTFYIFDHFFLLKFREIFPFFFTKGANRMSNIKCTNCKLNKPENASGL